MARITFDIPDNHVQRVVNALCASAGVEATQANAKDVIMTFVRRTVANVERPAPVEPPEPDVRDIIA